MPSDCDHPRINWVARNVSGRSILDIGFAALPGFPPVAHQLVRQHNPYSFIVGLDTNQEKVLKHGFDNSVVGDAFALPFTSETFHAVILTEVLEHVYSPYKIFAEIHRCLVVGGKLCLTTPDPYYWPRWLKHWLFAKKPIERANYRRFLGARDHKLYWDPLSLCSVLYDCGFEVTELTTKVQHIPFLARVFPKARSFDIDFYPFNRLARNTCLVAKKRSGQCTNLAQVSG